MVYKVIGLMSGSSLDGLDIAYVHLQERSGKWDFEIVAAACIPYPEEWKKRLGDAPHLSALEYQLLHVEYGHYLGQRVLEFIDLNKLHYQVQLIGSHGHTSFHLPQRKMTAQLGDGAAIAATTGINTVSDLRAMDLALGGQGAPIVPIGDHRLFRDYPFFLNLGGIANISSQTPFIAFDVCPANRVLNLLAAQEGKDYDEGGALTAGGKVNEVLLAQLNALPYYSQTSPKSLSNDFGTDTIYPMIRAAGLSTADGLRTYTEHICVQIARALSGQLASPLPGKADGSKDGVPNKLLVTGGGAHNTFLIGVLESMLGPLQIEMTVPDQELVDYKEALVMALIGVLRWREENNVQASVTGACRDSIGGAVWIGQEV